MILLGVIGNNMLKQRKVNFDMKRMNRFFSTMCLAGAVAFLVSSCNKNDEKVKMTVGLPTFEVSDPEPGENERVYLDFTANKFKWNANDQIMVYNLDATNGENTVKAIHSTDASAEGQTLATFTGDDLGAKKDHYFIFYPVSKIVNGAANLDAGNYETFNVPAEQTYTTIKGNPTVDPNSLAAACEVDALNNQFSLKHIFGICGLRLKGNTRTVSSIVLHDNAMALSGNVTMKLHEVRMGKFQQLLENYTIDANGNFNESFVEDWNNYRMELGYSAEAEGNDLTLNCGDGVQLQVANPTTFYFVVRPGAFIKGFTITVNYTEGEPDVITQYAAPKDSYKMRPGYIKGFAPAALPNN